MREVEMAMFLVATGETVLVHAHVARRTRAFFNPGQHANKGVFLIVV